MRKIFDYDKFQLTDISSKHSRVFAIFKCLTSILFAEEANNCDTFISRYVIISETKRFFFSKSGEVNIVRIQPKIS